MTDEDELAWANELSMAILEAIPADGPVEWEHWMKAARSAMATLTRAGWRPPLPEQAEGQSPWDAYVAAYREYQETDPHGATAHPTAHHMHALEAALRVVDSPVPRVFFPGDTVPAHTPVVNHVGGVWRQHADRVVKTGYALEIALPSPEERDHAAARALRARDEREEPPA